MDGLFFSPGWLLLLPAQAHFQKQLADILHDVGVESNRAKAREQQLRQELGDLKSQLGATVAQLAEQRSENRDLSAALRAIQAEASAFAQQAEAAAAAHAAEAEAGIAAEQQHRQALAAAKAEQAELLQEQQKLLDALAHRDQQVRTQEAIQHQTLCCLQARASAQLLACEL